jgi:hypothetical protein
VQESRRGDTAGGGETLVCGPPLTLSTLASTKVRGPIVSIAVAAKRGMILWAVVVLFLVAVVVVEDDVHVDDGDQKAKDKKTVILSLGGQRDNSFFIEEPPRSLPSDENLSFCFFHVEGTRYCALQRNIKGTKPL